MSEAKEESQSTPERTQQRIQISSLEDKQRENICLPFTGKPDKRSLQTGDDKLAQNNQFFLKKGKTSSKSD